MAKQSLASILAAKKKPQKFINGGVAQTSNSGLSSQMQGINNATPANALAPLVNGQTTNSTIGNLGQGSLQQQGAGSSGFAGSWGNVDQLPGYSAQAQQAAYNLNLAPQQSQIQQGYDTAGATANQAQNYTAALQSQQQAGASGAYNFTNALQQQALGNGPSLATAQLKQAQDQSLAQQLGAAAASRGGNAAMTQRTLAQNQALSGQQLGAQAATTQIQNQQALAQSATNAQNAATSQVGTQASSATNAQQAQTAQQQLQQSYINQGMTAAQAQQQASQAYMQSVTQQQETAAAQEANIQTAQVAGQYGLAESNTAAQAPFLSIKDGGPVDMQRPSSLASALSKQIYERDNSIPSFANSAIHAADGYSQGTQSLGISPIASPGATPAKNALEVGPTGSAPQTNQQQGKTSSSNSLQGAIGMGAEIAAAAPYVQASASAAAPWISALFAANGGAVDMNSPVALKDGGAQYAPSEQEQRIARNLTRDVLMPQFADGGLANPIWRGPGIPETSESVADTGTGIQKPVWRGPGIPETFESSYGSVLAARRQLKK